MKKFQDFLFLQELDEFELVNIVGGTTRPSGGAQWVGYYLHAAWDAVYDFASTYQSPKQVGYGIPPSN